MREGNGDLKGSMVPSGRFYSGESQEHFNLLIDIMFIIGNGKIWKAFMIPPIDLEVTSMVLKYIGDGDVGSEFVMPLVDEEEIGKEDSIMDLDHGFGFIDQLESMVLGLNLVYLYQDFRTCGTF